MILTKNLFFLNKTFNVPVRNKIISLSKVRKTVMKQKFKRYFLLTLVYPFHYTKDIPKIWTYSELKTARLDFHYCTSNIFNRILIPQGSGI